MLDESDRRGRFFAAISWALPFALVVFLALRGGGYEEIARDQVFVVLWAAVLVGALVGLLTAVRVTRAAWIALALLAAFLAWTWLSSKWSDSVERSLDLVPMIGGYLAVLALAVMTSGRAAVVRMVGAVGAAIAVVAVLALLSRYFPDLFPEDEAAAQVAEVAARLKYPLGSWNGLAGLIAMGIPLLLAIAVDAKSLVARVLAAAAVPMSVLAIGYTISRGGLIAGVLAAAAFVALHPRRMAMVPLLGVLLAGSFVLLLAASQFDALRNLTEGFESERIPMFLITLVVSAAVGGGAFAVIRAQARGRLRIPTVSPATTRRALIGAAGVLAVVVVGAIATGEASDAWQRFKDPAAPGETSGRLSSGSGNQRYQQWDAALAAAKEDPVGGKGAGTYEYWWARTAPVPGYSKYAHSLYFESLAETGFVGMALIVGFVAFVLLAILRRALRAPAAMRAWLGAALGSAAAFALTMAIDWSWHIAVVPVAFLLVSGAAIQVGTSEHRWRPGPTWVLRGALALLAVGMIAFTAISWYGDQRYVDSQQAVKDGDLDAGLEAAEDAESAQPHAATPHLQKALVLEQQEDLDGAVAEINIAINKNFFDWEPRYVLSRLVELMGDREEGKLYFERARQLNPRSPIFLNDADESALTPNE